jgi:hypothetical protein
LSPLSSKHVRAAFQKAAAGMKVVYTDDASKDLDGFLLISRPTIARGERPIAESPNRKARDVRGPSFSSATSKILGAGEGIRTLDPDLGKVVLYH